MNLSKVAHELALVHQSRCRLLEAFDEESGGWLKECEDALVSDISNLECELCQLQTLESESIRKLELGENQGQSLFELRSVALVDVSDGSAVTGLDREPPCSGEGPDDEGDAPPLQTRIISADQVRREPDKWRGPITEEYESLVKKTEAVEELTEAQYQALLEDPKVAVELIPGKLVYVHKTSGRRKARIVGCGNYCVQSGSGPRSELYASGAGAESLRMTVRRAALDPTWCLASVDVKTAFLQAPLLDLQRGGKQLITIVRVPSVLRELGVTVSRFWRVQKALYGLASAPKSWNHHRDKVLSELRIPYEGGVLVLAKMQEDANLLHVLKLSSASSSESGAGVTFEGAQKVGVVPLYVDDILVAAPRAVAEAVVTGLQGQWELSQPEWLSAVGDSFKFAGFELQRTAEGIRLHQESYARDLMNQYSDAIPGTESVPAVKAYEVPEPTGDTDLLSTTRKAQAVIGQVLWLSNRTRPDLAYAVNMAAQKIVANPLEALARAEHIIRYIRHSPGVGLHYKPARLGCGRWDQLKYEEHPASIDAFSDTSFAADEQCRSFGSIQLFWAGAMIAWSANRQTLIASHHCRV